MPKYELKMTRTQFATMLVEADNSDVIDEAWDNDLFPDNTVEDMNWEVDDGSVIVESTDLMSSYHDTPAELVIEIERQVKVTRARHLNGAVR